MKNAQHLPDPPMPPEFLEGVGVLFHMCIQMVEVDTES